MQISISKNWRFWTGSVYCTNVDFLLLILDYSYARCYHLVKGIMYPFKFYFSNFLRIDNYFKNYINKSFSTFSASWWIVTNIHTSKQVLFEEHASGSLTERWFPLLRPHFPSVKWIGWFKASLSSLQFWWGVNLSQVIGSWNFSSW